MDFFGVRLVFTPAVTLQLLGFILGGVALGTLSGLIPGLHANNFALLLASVVPVLPGSPTHVGAAMLAAGVVHTFLDVIPAIALGVPDAAMIATALPGHQLVIQGRGREALRLSALGSGLAVLFAVPLAVPITVGMVEFYPVLRDRLSLVLVGLVVFLVVTESSHRARVGGAVTFTAAALLGFATLDRSGGLLDAGGMLAPLFAGLFGAPVLIDAIDGNGVPAQADARITVAERVVGTTAFAGTVAGAIVGYLPGVSSAIAAVVILAVVPTAGGARGFIVATSGINTANMVFALFALVALGTPRAGVLVALDTAEVPLNLPVLLGAVGIAGAVGFVLVPFLGDHYLRIVGRIRPKILSLTILSGLAGLAYLFGGLIGIGAYVAGAVIGLLPPRTGARRVHCMGVLLGPLILR